MIVIFEQDLTHYRAAFYDYLGKVLEEDILILYGKGEPGSDHIFIEEETERGFKTLKIPRKWIGRSYYFQSLSDIKKAISGYNITCVIHRGAIRNLGLFREVRYFKKKGIPVIIRGKGFGNGRSFNPSKSLLDRVHKKIVDVADIFLCYTDGSREILSKFCDANKVYVAVNTLNSNLLKAHLATLRDQGKREIKKELRLAKDKYLIHVGRFTRRKKIQKLIDIYVDYKKMDNNVGLILIGDGPDNMNLRNYVAENKIEDVVFTGASSSENLLTSKYIFSADIFIIPGAIGLSINHAFLLGLPVIAYVAPEGHVTDKDYMHGPEFEYLINGYNGVSVPDTEIGSFVDAVIEVLQDTSYAANALEYGYNKLTVEKMAEGYLTAINDVLKR